METTPSPQTAAHVVNPRSAGSRRWWPWRSRPARCASKPAARGREADPRRAAARDPSSEQHRAGRDRPVLGRRGRRSIGRSSKRALARLPASRAATRRRAGCSVLSSRTSVESQAPQRRRHVRRVVSDRRIRPVPHHQRHTARGRGRVRQGGQPPRRPASAPPGAPAATTSPRDSSSTSSRPPDTRRRRPPVALRWARTGRRPWRRHSSNPATPAHPGPGRTRARPAGRDPAGCGACSLPGTRRGRSGSRHRTCCDSPSD